MDVQRATSRPQTLGEILHKTQEYFHRNKIETARLDAELILAHGLGLRRIDLYLKFEQPLKEAELATCRELVRRRSQGEPVAYILGQKEFYGLDFKVSPAVLIPRPETEHVVDLALECLRKTPADEYRIADFGCGSGCIGFAIAKNLAGCQLWAVEISEAAITVAKENAANLELTEQIEFVHNSVEEAALPQGLDLIVGNPPYIAENDPDVMESVKKFEPTEALFAPENGLACIRSWTVKAAEVLRSGQPWIFEIGASQGAAVEQLLQESGQFEQIQIKKDYSARDRIAFALRK